MINRWLRKIITKRRHVEMAVSRKWRVRDGRRKFVRWCWKKLSPEPKEECESRRTAQLGKRSQLWREAFFLPSVRVSERIDLAWQERKGICSRFKSLSPPRPSRFEMGKEQELLEAARIGNLAAVEKLLSGKRQSTGIGGGSSGTAGSSSSGGHSSSSHLSNLLRYGKTEANKTRRRARVNWASGSDLWGRQGKALHIWHPCVVISFTPLWT